MSPIDDDELDRLADYTAGLLDPAQAARVRELIAQDPDWARAYAGLTTTGTRLDADLADLRDPPIPTEVADRLTAALALETPPAPARTATVVDLSTRRRWTRRAAGLTAVAAALAAILGSVAALSSRQGETASTSAGRAPAPISAPAAGSAVADTAQLVVRHSGTDYTAQTLGRVNGAPGAVAPVPSAPAGGLGSKQEQAPRAPQPAAPALDRLGGDAALHQCLATIVDRYGGQPTAVDYARFDGAPALIVSLSDRRIVVAGPDCGLPGSGDDERYTVK